LTELKKQLVGALLVVLTAAALISAAVNFQQHQLYHLPEDGVVWVDRTAAGGGPPEVTALDVQAGSGAALAGLRAGDRLIKINNFPISTAIDAARVLARIGPWKEGEYVIQRQGVEFKSKVIVRERTIEATLLYQYGVGLCYLAIGLFVYLRRNRAPLSVHFYCLCLASFVLMTFHYTGKLNEFDKVMYWGNVIAGLFAPTIFLHFCLAFPDRLAAWASGGRAVLLYVPAAAASLIYLGFAYGAIRVTAPLGEVRWILDRAWLVFLSGGYLIGCLVAWVRSRQVESGLVRQQLKWLRNGALAGVLPFTLAYTIPFALGIVPNWAMNLTVFSLALVPLSWAYAILRLRLMDVDLIFQQGTTYTLATLGVLGAFYGLVLAAQGSLHEMTSGTLALMMMAATFLFQPLRNWIQETLDRYVFYKGRYDYRRTLLEFARELGTETDLDHMLTTAAERLRSTLSIKNVAFFLSEERDGFTLAKFVGEDARLTPIDRFDLSFLTPNPAGPIFFEHTRSAFDVLTGNLTDSVRATVAKLGLSYYIPCQVRGRTIAYLGASRTFDGSFLSSEDVELVTTLAGYVGIAVDNALLYRSLKQKAEEYERLKEFSENIVESINVGIVAADLEDRVESWNSQMEIITGVSRERATGQRLRDLFPAAFMQSLDQTRELAGVHQLYKIPLRQRSWGQTSVAAVAATSNGNGNGGSHSGARPERLVNLAIAPLVTREQEQIGRLIIFDDVTERAELEQRLVQTDKLSSIGLLAAGVAHEVNTPLAVISSYAQMLTKQIAGDDPKSKLLDKIAKQTFRASEIVNSLLNFSRTSKTEFEEVDLNRTIRETLSLIEHQFDKEQVRVEFAPEADLPGIKGNNGKLQQVFLNLFLNARDAMEQGGVLRISTASDDGRARVTVTDSGKGIEPEHLSRIYDPFFTTKGAKKGTGLGLAVTYGIVREHGGNIEAESRPGEGSTFVLDFPLVRKLVNA
jgi:two-component system, NtrC family, sensor kinase